MTDEVVATLRSAISENDSHVAKIRRAVSLLSTEMPLTKDSFVSLSEQSVLLVDQLIYRFTKMQDSLGTRFFPTLFSLLEGDRRPRPFLDVLNRLEQLRILDSVETWQFFRDLRNRLAHDYPETIDQTVATINILQTRVEQLLALYETARQACLDRLTPSRP